MKHLRNNDWLRECPYHVQLSDTQVADRAVDWCLETLEPREWHMVENPGGIGYNFSSMKKVTTYLFAFKQKDHAALFKLMWWKT